MIALSAAAGLSQAWFVCGVLAAVTFILAFRTFRESCSAMGSVLRVLQGWGEGEGEE